MIKSNEIYINDQNLKIFDSPGLNNYKIPLDKVIQAGDLYKVIYEPSIFISQPNLINIDNTGTIQVIEEGMYSINCIFQFQESDDPNIHGVSYNVYISINRQSGLNMTIADDSGRFEAPIGEGNTFLRYRSLSTTVYLKPTDSISVIFASGFNANFSITLFSNVTSMIINRIY